MSAFVKRWHKETSSFHLPIEEVTITLDDIASLLHLLIVGAFHSFELLHVDDAVDMLVELLEPKRTCCICLDAHSLLTRVPHTCTWYSWTQSESYAWGTATLVHMYDNLNDASKSTVSEDVTKCFFTGVEYYMLPMLDLRAFLVRWFRCTYEDYDERRPRACRWTSGKALLVSTYRRHLDRLTPDMFSEYIAPVGQLCVVPDHFLADYMDWFYMISHPFMSPAQSGDPHRVSPIQQYDTFVEPNVY
ncbi:Protein MAIN-LIKE 1 [Glycine max]|nr:Protein MAIN-LIKE 1 [Glycine max]